MNHPARFARAVFGGAFLALLLTLPGTVFGVGDVLEVHRPQADFDLRSGVLTPDGAAVALADSLGATVSWNRFGTPHTLFVEGGFLSGPLGGTAEEAARQWLRDHRDLFRLSPASVDDLLVIRESPVTASGATVVLFGQQVGGMPVAHDGRIKVALANGRVYWVSSSAVGELSAPGAGVLSAAEAWLASATSLGFSFGLGDLTSLGQDGGWSLFEAGLSHPQRVRSMILALPGGGALPAFETIFLSVAGGAAHAYTSFVDANSGEVLIRRNRTWRLAGGLPGTPLQGFRTEPFDGTYQDAPDPLACGAQEGPFSVGLLEGWSRIIVLATAGIPTNDVFLRLYRGANLLAEQDLATSPEALVYEPAGGISPGNYYVEVCPFAAPTVPAAAPYNYAGAISFTKAQLPNVFQLPRWTYFPAHPPVDGSSVDTRQVGCWSEVGYDGAPISGCGTVFENDAARSPWDYDFLTRQGTRTTLGNGALSALSWVSPLTPSVPIAPIALDRDYSYAWNNTWYESGCNPLQIPFADTNAAVTNLFVAHNRMHDWSYYLGFTERNGNAQVSNFGLTPPERENDPEIGNAQAGALTGGFPTYLGRDNANQITLNDGIAPITNMYLWQSVGGTAYAPCVDGDFDMAIVGHEYGHMIQNRMVDPDNGLAGDHGRAMGESWSDLTAIEYLNGYGLVPVGDENPFAVGAYATGDKDSGVRNFPMNDSPLNFSNMDYDPSGPASASPHSNGEIWSAVNFDVRQALMAKYDATHPSSDAALQERCASGLELPQDCPGNRRWIQILHDAFLLMPSTPTMLDARDAYLAADAARATDPAWPSNQVELWEAFAARGFGADASTDGAADVDPTPSFRAPTGGNGTVTFVLKAADEGGAPVTGEVYVGHYEARTVPVADTDSSTALGASASFVAGTYEILVRANGYGHARTTFSVSGGQTKTVTVNLRTNYASTYQGASAAGDGTDFTSLIDDSEATTWQNLEASPDVDGSSVTIALDGRKTIRRAQVSAMLEPGENRFEALRAYELQACDATERDCSLDSNFTTIYQSAGDAFPGGSFRPSLGELKLQTVTFPQAQATHVRFVVSSNQCTGNVAYQSVADNDPLNETDCRVGNAILSARNLNVTAAEVQLFKH